MSGYPSEWNNALTDRYPFEHEGAFWFIAVEGFHAPLVQGPYTDRNGAEAAWFAQWRLPLPIPR
jgi:hypothetical protein